MEFRQLRYFVSVVTHRSFTKASEKLHIAQPALSRHLQLLEQEFQVPLLIRNSRGVEMTEAGRRFKDMAEFILRYAADIKSTLSETNNEPVGEAVIGLPPSLASLLAPKIMAQVAATYPMLKLRVIEGLSIFLVEWLEQGKIDIAVLTDYGPTPGIERKDMVNEELIFVAAPQRFEGLDDSIELARIVDHPLIITHGFRALMEPWFATHHVDPEYVMELDSLSILKDMLISGAYCSVLSYGIVHKEVESGQLRALRFSGASVERRVITAVKANRPQSAKIDAIASLIYDELHEIPLRPDPG